MALSKVRLRQWQRDALDKLNASDSPDFLAVATPGAGKTTFALTAARLMLPNLPGRLVVVVPTRHLKVQWAQAALKFGLLLEQNWTTDSILPADVHGIITTYQQVGMSAQELFDVSQGGFVILDEVHHAGDDRIWGKGIKTAFDAASKRLALSGTPFRSDTSAIPFVTYENNEAVADYEYGYGDALSDGSVVRPVYFPRFGGQMEWTSPEGSHISATFDDVLLRSEANQRLRAAFSLEGDWLPAVLENAIERLTHIRKSHSNAAGLIIATDQTHARGISKLLRDRFKIDAEIVVSEEVGASKKISKFAESNKPWLVAVRMVSEGVDIPRLRVGVYATTTTTELFFRQAVGRFVRHIKGGGLQRAYVFIPDDYRLRRYGFQIAESRRHSLEKKSDDDQLFSDGEKFAPEEQISLFEVHSATMSDAIEDEVDPFSFDPEVVDKESESEDDFELNNELLVDFSSMPLSGGSSNNTIVSAIDGRSERDRLRSVNQSLAKDIAELTGKSHAEVNSQLNKSSGVIKISQASIIQLNRRMREAEKWIQLLSRRRV